MTNIEVIEAVLVTAVEMVSAFFNERRKQPEFSDYPDPKSDGTHIATSQNVAAVYDRR